MAPSGCLGGRWDGVGIVGYGTWSQGLVGDARLRTRELLDSERFGQQRNVPSVHLSLYLRWAEGDLRAEAEAAERQRPARAGGLDLGRHIQSFLP